MHIALRGDNLEKFSRTLHGYNPEEVNSFLDEVINQVEKLIESNRQKNEEILLLKSQIKNAKTSDELIKKAQKFDELESTLNKAIVMAENTGEHIRRVAKQERDLMLEEAKKNASIIINDALVRSEKIEYQASLLRKNIIMFKRKLKINLEEQLKLVDDITSLNKEYIAEVTLGIKTDTLDITGNILEKYDVKSIDKEKLETILKSFIGKYDMKVPIYSAVKVNGKKLYEYAREGKNVELPRKIVYINSIELLNVNGNKFTFKCNVSKGTYIRSLINDICNKMNLIGCMSDLIRTKQGKFYIENALDLEDINENTPLINMIDVIDFPIYEVDEFLFNKIKNGSKLENRYTNEKIAFSYNKKLIGIYIEDINDKTKIKPKNIFV